MEIERKERCVKNYFDRPLFIFEMANNHMGSVEHGLTMISAFAEVAKAFQFQFAFKFQFRDLDTFIHPDYSSRMDIKAVKRFSETRLSRDQYQQLKDSVIAHGFISICTPFDEPSVDRIEDMGFDIIKIASCSFTDWPLLERIVQTQKPIIASTAGATLDEIDKVVSFFQNRHKMFAILHCVGEYPTKMDTLNLNQIDLLKQRYPGVTVGYSTHEEPDNLESIQIAIAKGGSIFEKHVAVETAEFKKNEYSATPGQINRWLQSAERAYRMGGIVGQRSKATVKEMDDLRQYKRGVFARRPIMKGEKIDATNTFFAFPNVDNQLLANDISKYTGFVADVTIEKHAPVKITDITWLDQRERVYSIVQEVKKILGTGNVVVPGMATLEISHHYGLDRFHDIGCTIINVVNREYCKKLIVVLPGQKHPEQYHKIKEETFVVLYGDVTITLDGVATTCQSGDVVTVIRGMKHIFTSRTGAVIEEISSTHYRDDSYYTDESILQNKERKTIISHWMG
jgi:sialic acid synthase SpsE/quercetin dioxygenase-like cupin family protein